MTSENDIVWFWYECPARNLYISEPGFDYLYVRKGPTYLGGKWHSKVLQLAKLAALEPGRGAFTHLIQKIEALTDAEVIFVENVFNERFAQKLLQLGFRALDMNNGFPYCFIKQLPVAVP